MAFGFRFNKILARLGERDKKWTETVEIQTLKELL
jgi:hypothetical protein